MDERIACRICLFLNTIDALNVDCDLFDDGLDNDSCQAGPPPTTTSTTTTTTSTSTSTSSTSTVTTTSSTSTSTISSTTTTTTSSTTSTTLPVPLDHFTLYNAVGPDAPVVTLADQFLPAPMPVDLGALVWLMPPSQKNNEPVFSWDEHLTCYQLPPDPFAATVQVSNQFGEQLLDVFDPAALCVPSEKSPVFPGQTPPEQLLRDHYKCYFTAGSPPPSPPVSLLDQFLDDPAVPVGPVILFCNPADKNFEGIDNLADHPTCYDAPAPFATSVWVRNQLTTADWAMLDLLDRTALCVPSIKVGWVPM